MENNKFIDTCRLLGNYNGENIYILKKNNYISDITNEEIDDIKFYKRLFKKISDELEDINV